MAIAKAKPAPDFLLKLTDGTGFVLSERLTAAPLLLFFFKTTCPVCQLASPYIERMAQSGAKVFGVCQDLELSKAVRYSNEYRLSFPVMLEQSGYDVSNRYDIDVVPTLIVIDANGSIVESVECFDRKGYEAVAKSLTVNMPFFPEDNVPSYRPG